MPTFTHSVTSYEYTQFQLASGITPGLSIGNHQAATIGNSGLDFIKAVMLAAATKTQLWNRVESTIKNNGPGFIERIKKHKKPLHISTHMVITKYILVHLEYYNDLINKTCREISHLSL